MKWFCLFSVLLLLAVVPAVVLNDLPERDMAHRYIPMAEAFAAGNYAFAFHPRIPPLCTTLGGVIALLTGLGSFMALKIASAFWHLAGGAVLYRLFRLLYPDRERPAVIGVLLYFFFPYSFILAYSGLREPAKGFCLYCLTLALLEIYRERSRLRGYLLLGAGCGLAVLTRAEMITLSLLALTAATALELRRFRRPLKSAASFLLAAAIAAPGMLINAFYFGAPVPDYRFALLFGRCFGRDMRLYDLPVLALLFAALIYLAGLAIVKIVPRLGKKRTTLIVVVALTAALIVGCILAPPSACRVDKFGVTLLKGFYHFITIIAILHLVVRRYVRKQPISGGETIVLAVVAANVFVCTAQMLFFNRVLYLSERYIAPATPLLFVFFLFGIDDFREFFRRFLPRSCVTGIEVLFWSLLALLFVIHGYQGLWRDYRKESRIELRRAVFTVRDLIADDYTGPRRRTGAPDRKRLGEYQSCRMPRVFFRQDSRLTVSAVLAGGSETRKMSEADYIVTPKAPKKFRFKLKKLGSVRVGDGPEQQVFRVIK